MAQGGACTHGRSLLCEAGAVHRRASFAYVPNAMPQSVLLSQVTGEALDEEGLDQGLDQASTTTPPVRPPRQRVRCQRGDPRGDAADPPPRVSGFWIFGVGKDAWACYFKYGPSEGGQDADAVGDGASGDLGAVGDEVELVRDAGVEVELDRDAGATEGQ